MSEGLVLALDGGQTSTTGVLARRDGSILGVGHGGPCDHLHASGGVERNRVALHGAIDATVHATGVDASEISAVGLGSTSAPRERDTVGVFEGLIRERLAPTTVWVDADYVASLAGAAAGEPGVVVIAGGGSVGYGVAGDGRDAVSGGLGYLLGDEGSAWFIGLQAVIATVKAHDRRGPETALLPRVLGHFQLRGIREIIEVIYGEAFSRHRIAELAPIVVSFAGNGDAVARQIVTDAGERLAEIALGVLRQLDGADAPDTVYPVGGVFQAGEAILNPFRQRLQSAWSTAQIGEPRFPPVIGALIRAFEAEGDPLDAERLDRVARTLPVP